MIKIRTREGVTGYINMRYMEGIIMYPDHWVIVMASGYNWFVPPMEGLRILREQEEMDRISERQE